MKMWQLTAEVKRNLVEATYLVQIKANEFAEIQALEIKFMLLLEPFKSIGKCKEE